MCTNNISANSNTSFQSEFLPLWSESCVLHLCTFLQNVRNSINSIYVQAHIIFTRNFYLSDFSVSASTRMLVLLRCISPRYIYISVRLFSQILVFRDKPCCFSRRFISETFELHDWMFQETAFNIAILGTRVELFKSSSITRFSLLFSARDKFISMDLRLLKENKRGGPLVCVCVCVSFNSVAMRTFSRDSVTGINVRKV